MEELGFSNSAKGNGYFDRKSNSAHRLREEFW
jgi:hypothetical protein